MGLLKPDGLRQPDSEEDRQDNHDDEDHPVRVAANADRRVTETKRHCKILPLVDLGLENVEAFLTEVKPRRTASREA